MEILKNLFMIEKLKHEIENKRARLNNLIVSDGDKNEVLEYSMELDRLIGEFYEQELNGQKM